MGVDYSAHYGIGIKITLPEFDEDHKWFEDELGWLDEILESTGYFYFEVGDSMYTGKSNKFYICIDEPFSEGYCGLKEKADKLLEFLQENEIKFEGKVGIVGGLEIW